MRFATSHACIMRRKSFGVFLKVKEVDPSLSLRIMWALESTNGPVGLSAGVSQWVKHCQRYTVC